MGRRTPQVPRTSGSPSQEWRSHQIAYEQQLYPAPADWVHSCTRNPPPSSAYCKHVYAAAAVVSSTAAPQDFTHSARQYNMLKHDKARTGSNLALAAAIWWVTKVGAHAKDSIGTPRARVPGLDIVCANSRQGGATDGRAWLFGRSARNTGLTCVSGTASNGAGRPP